MRDEPRDPRAERHRVGPGHARRAERRPDGPRHRPGRLRATCPRQATDDDGDARGGDPGHPGARGRRADRVRGHRAPLPLDAGLAAPGLGGRLRPDGPGDDRPRRRRGHPPAGRPGSGRVVRRADPGRGGRSGSRTRLHQGPGRGAGPRRHLGRLSRADPVVPRAGEQPRRRPGEQVRARPAAGHAHRLHPRPRGLRLPPPRRGRLLERSLRRGRGHGPVLRPRLRGRSHRQAPAADGGRRRPVQHLPDERRRGGRPRGLRPGDHPGDASGDRRRLTVPSRRDPAALIAAVSTAALVLTGCVATTAPSASAPSASPEPQLTVPPRGISPPPSEVATPAVVPPAIAGEIHCPALDVTIPAAIFGAPATAERAPTGPAAALRSYVSEASTVATGWPAAGWRLVSATDDRATFLARGGDTWWIATFAREGIAWTFFEGGNCDLQVALPNGVGFASWRVDPANAPKPDDTTLHLLGSELACANGKPPLGR